MMSATQPKLASLAHIGAVAVVCHMLLAIGMFAGSAYGQARDGADGKDIARPLRIVAFGDSLTAGFGLQPGDAFPLKLERALRAKGHAVEVTNAGVSGDTTAAGLERLDWAVPDRTDIVILELGANDALRGQDPAIARRNLDRIIVRLKAKGAAVLLAGMLAPRNWGPDYSDRFDTIFPDLAKAHDLLLYPFFLEGIAMQPQFNLDDGLHPNARGVDVIVAGILPVVERLISDVRASLARRD